jgi:hypothetical protein
VKKFERPIAELIAMDVSDIITTSPNEDEWSDEGDEDWDEE